MKSLQKKLILSMIAFFIVNANAQETFILNY